MSDEQSVRRVPVTPQLAAVVEDERARMQAAVDRAVMVAKIALAAHGITEGEIVGVQGASLLVRTDPPTA